MQERKLISSATLPLHQLDVFIPDYLKAPYIIKKRKSADSISSSKMLSTVSTLPQRCIQVGMCWRLPLRSIGPLLTEEWLQKVWPDIDLPHFDFWRFAPPTVLSTGPASLPPPADTTCLPPVADFEVGAGQLVQNIIESLPQLFDLVLPFSFRERWSHLRRFVLMGFFCPLMQYTSVCEEDLHTHTLVLHILKHETPAKCG